jgi:hypothetical protein
MGVGSCKKTLKIQNKLALIFINRALNVFGIQSIVYRSADVVIRDGDS